MEIKKFKPKTNFDEALLKITENFFPIYQAVEKRIATLDNSVVKGHFKNKERLFALDFIAVYNGEKVIFRMIEDHAKFFYALREIVSEYGEAIGNLSEQMESLAKQTTNKKSVTGILEQIKSVKDGMSKLDRKLNDTRSDAEDSDKLLDELFRNLSDDEGSEKP